MFGSRKKPKINVRMKVAGFVDGKLVTREFEVQAPEGASVKKLFSMADKSKELDGKVISKIMAMPRPPTVMINGDSMDLPGALKTRLKNGDEVSVMTPMAGG